MISIDEYQEVFNKASGELKDCLDSKTLQELKIKYLGRKGIVASLFKDLAGVSKDERPSWGKRLNELKAAIESFIREKERETGKKSAKEGFFDSTLPVDNIRLPMPHPINQVLTEIVNIFTCMGFGVAYGPEIENNYYNFTALNFPEDHPACDMHDTLYLKKEHMLLRTHTSPVQIRIMQKNPPPYKFIAPGKCYRRDTIDASHSPVFYQVEGLMVDENISFSDLKGILDEFARRIFPGKIKTRFRPSYFPFTEPSAEVDIMCGLCMGKGCSSCSGKGWLEILGAGMVDLEVFRHCNVDVTKWQGFAFGMGVERIAMLKYGITDMRLFYQNDLRFLQQF